jgi:hypothetical protein
MSDWIIEWIASAEGINAADLQTIEAAIPAAQALLDLLKQAMPLITKAMPLIQEVQPAAAIILKTVAKKQQVA